MSLEFRDEPKLLRSAEFAVEPFPRTAHGVLPSLPPARRRKHH
jgi:hypothetical protein